VMEQDLADRLAAIARHESTIRATPLTRLLRRVGKFAWFAAAARTVGPIVDPPLAKVRDGALMAKVYGLPYLIMVTTGAKTGQPRTSPLLYLRDGTDFIVVGTSFGQPRHPGWTANLLAHPGATVTIGGTTLGVAAEQMDEAQWQQQFPRFVTLYPGYANYLERRRGLAPRMFRLRPDGPS
jgi:deazaflavin-dependent oxidoreductase (nitroreductase family)